MSASDTIPTKAVEVLAACVAQNVADAASTANAIQSYDDRVKRTLATALVTLRERLDDLPFSTHALDAAYDAAYDAFVMAHRILDGDTHAG